MATKTAEKPSIASIVDPMLKSGKHTMAEMVDAIKKLRPDFKCPSAGIGNRKRALAGGAMVKAGALETRGGKRADGKLSAGDIAEPMLLKGTHTRAEIMAEVARLRPDFKDPSAAVSNRFRLLVQQGKNPGLKEGVRPVREFDGNAMSEASRQARIDKRLKAWDDYVKRNDEEVEQYRKRREAFYAAAAKEPKMKRVWPV